MTKKVFKIYFDDGGLVASRSSAGFSRTKLWRNSGRFGQSFSGEALAVRLLVLIKRIFVAHDKSRNNREYRRGSFKNGNLHCALAEIFLRSRKNKAQKKGIRFRGEEPAWRRKSPKRRFWAWPFDFSLENEPQPKMSAYY
jgi:hypothetical protein